jgi:hypothetical protein
MQAPARAWLQNVAGAAFLASNNCLDLAGNDGIVFAIVFAGPTLGGNDGIGGIIFAIVFVGEGGRARSSFSITASSASSACLSSAYLASTAARRRRCSSQPGRGGP